MLQFRAPEVVPPALLQRSVFLAGGITGTEDWQQDLTASLADLDLTILNPRRDGYNALDPHALRQQITWEHDHLRAASAVSFWFPREAPCLISLFELGSWSHWRDAAGQVKPLLVGIEAGYVRRENIEIQLELERPDVQVVASLPELSQQIRDWYALFV